ncbi:MAG TPA: NAD(P)H-dependent glycerol-3-phosphate dehydrogenase [Burkholderiaceae bacterium]|nr:NAD(P)H-dependent glycerol-3-phosphate dehydrogenase [Burkholderiaceae bacterium]
MRIGVLGAGAWGTALAIHAAAGNEVMLWLRDDAQLQRLRATRCNERYLPEVRIPDGVALSGRRDEALSFARGGLTIVATPMSGLREQLAVLPAGEPVLWLSKGFEQTSGALGHEIARELRGAAPCGVVSGPSFALEVARGQPTALVAASTDPELVARAVGALHGPTLRMYASDDPIGVEVGGAVKNVLAIATGIADALALGLNARAALITRGLAEMTRLGVALGAKAETFMGLSGLGDLVLTATGDLSRNRQVGIALGQGRALPRILAQLGHVAEGVASAPMVLARARALGIEMPLCEAVDQVIAGHVTPREALEQLMTRVARSES